MAQPVRNSSGMRHVERDSDSDSDDTRNTASQLNGHGSNSPGRSGKPPALSTTSAANGGNLQNSSGKQPSPTGKAGAVASQPAYASNQTPSARELALRATAEQTRAAMQGKDPLKALKKIFKSAGEVRLMVPTHSQGTGKSDPYRQICERQWLMQIPIGHLDLRLDPCASSDNMGRLDQMAFVSALLSSCRDLSKSGNPALTIDLDVPMRARLTEFSSMDMMYSKNLYSALAESKVLVRVRIKDYQPKLDKSSWMTQDSGLLGGNKKIRELELLDCDFDDEDTCELAEALEINTSIKTLVLSNCSISDKGVGALAVAFSKRPDMQVVGFSPKPIASPAQPGSQNSNLNGKATKNPPSRNAASGASSSTATPTKTPAANTSSSTTTSTTATPAGTFQTAHANSTHEKELANAAAEAQAALKEDDPLPALKRLFNQRADIRIEVPVKILWKANDSNGEGDGYEKFSSVRCLSQLKLRNIEFIAQPCQAGESQFSQFDFLAYTLDSLNQLPKKSLANTSLAIVLPDTRTAEEVSVVTVRAQDGLFRSLASDRLTARLDLGSLAPRTEGSLALCRFFDSLPGKTKLVELKLCGAVLSRAETIALGEGLRENQSIQLLDLTGSMLDPGVRERFDDAVRERSDLKVLY